MKYIIYTIIILTSFVYKISVLIAEHEGKPSRTNISLDVVQYPFPRLIDDIRRQTGGNIYLGCDAQGNDINRRHDLLVTIKADNVHWETVLQDVTRDAGLSMKKIDDSVWLIYQTICLDIQFEDERLDRALSKLAHQAGRLIAWPSDPVNNKRVTMYFHKKPFLNILNDLGRVAGLIPLKDREGKVFILSTPSFARNAREDWIGIFDTSPDYLPDNVPFISININDKPLEAVIAYIQTFTANKISIDKLYVNKSCSTPIRHYLSLSLDNVHWYTILKLISESTGYKIDLNENGTIILQEQSPKRIQFNNLSLKQAIESVSQISNIEVDLSKDICIVHYISLYLDNDLPNCIKPTYEDILKAISGVAGFIVNKVTFRTYKLAQSKSTLANQKVQKEMTAETYSSIYEKWNRKYEAILKIPNDVNNKLNIYYELLMLEREICSDVVMKGKVDAQKIINLIKITKESNKINIISNAIENMREKLEKLKEYDEIEHRERTIMQFIETLPYYLEVNKIFNLRDTTFNLNSSIVAKYLRDKLINDGEVDIVHDITNVIIATVEMDYKSNPDYEDLYNQAQRLSYITNILINELRNKNIIVSGIIYEPHIMSRIAIINGVKLTIGQICNLNEMEIIRLIDVLSPNTVIIQYKGFNFRVYYQSRTDVRD